MGGIGLGFRGERDPDLELERVVVMRRRAPGLPHKREHHSLIVKVCSEVPSSAAGAVPDPQHPRSPRAAHQVLDDLQVPICCRAVHHGLLVGVAGPEHCPQVRLGVQGLEEGLHHLMDGATEGFRVLGL